VINYFKSCVDKNKVLTQKQFNKNMVVCIVFCPGRFSVTALRELISNTA